MKSHFELKFFLPLLICLLLGFIAALIVAQETESKLLSVQQWLEDLDAIEQFILEKHPNPWEHISREKFAELSDEIRTNIENMDDAQRTIAMMKLVAFIRDGHTELRPASISGFDQWFPVRYYVFFDGLRIVTVEDKDVDLLGLEVLRIGSVSVEDAVKSCGGVLGSGNDFGITMKAPMLLSNAGALAGLGIIDDPSTVDIVVRDKDGAEKIVTLKSEQKQFDTSWFFGSLSAGPLDSMNSSVFVASNQPHPAYLSRIGETFWFDILPDGKTMFTQINAMRDGKDESFRDFVDRMYTAFDENECKRLVIDIRFNTGGNGELSLPVLHGIIKRDVINRRGGLFVLLSQRTFSAAILLLGHLVEHTEALLVGSPPRSPLNHFGDADAMRLPNSRMLLICSTLFHQAGSASDNSVSVRLDIPAPIKYSDVQKRIDPALAAIERRRDFRTIANIFINDGAEAGLKAYEQRKADAGDFDWVNVYSGRALQGAGYALLGMGRADEAVRAFRLNAEVYPNVGFVWAALADGLLAVGDVEGVVDAARKLEKAGWRRSALGKLRDGIQAALEKQDISAARTFISYAIETYPDVATFWIFSGQLAEAEKDIEKAIESYRKALEIDAKREEALSALERLSASTS